MRSGQAYIGTILDLAAKRLREKGAFISPKIVDLAERLCLVEHVDHERFRLENHVALFEEIYSLYALNQLDTYRYSVSSAGAGGMVQMIPWAYNLIRQRHPEVSLTPDFVVGMRNHANALQAMLLYMQDTWTDLAANEDVQSALSSGIATQSELLAAGYNSNAAHLPLYIRRAGQAWRTLRVRQPDPGATAAALIGPRHRILQERRDLFPARDDAPPCARAPPVARRRRLSAARAFGVALADGRGVRARRARGWVLLSEGRLRCGGGTTARSQGHGAPAICGRAAENISTAGWGATPGSPAAS